MTFPKSGSEEARIYGLESFAPSGIPNLDHIPITALLLNIAERIEKKQQGGVPNPEYVLAYRHINEAIKAVKAADPTE